MVTSSTSLVPVCINRRHERHTKTPSPNSMELRQTKAVIRKKRERVIPSILRSSTRVTPPLWQTLPPPLSLATRNRRTMLANRMLARRTIKKKR